MYKEREKKNLGRFETVVDFKGFRFFVIEINGFGMKLKLLMKKDNFYIVIFVVNLV